jgi:WD40 repeat protein
LVQEMDDHSSSIRALAFSADGRRLATASSDGSAILWEAE